MSLAVINLKEGYTPEQKAELMKQEKKQLKVGFARVNIDPPAGIPVRGYYVPRYASGVLDSLRIQMAALSAGASKEVAKDVYNPDTGRYEKRAVADPSGCILMAAIDNCGLSTKECNEIRSRIEQNTGVPFANIYLHSDHTHTAPFTEPEEDHTPAQSAMIRAYQAFLMERAVLAAVEALQDLKPARMGIGTAMAPERVAYIRRYRMKDGRTMTCPPIDDPLIDHPIGELDQRIHVLRFDREGGDTVVFMNYGLHADTLNLDLISSDWPGELSKTFEAAIPGTKIVAFVGAQGDVGSTRVFPQPGDLNETLISFDNEMKSAGMCRFVGRALAGSVMQIYDKVEYIEVDQIGALNKTVSIAANVPTAAELAQAKEYRRLHDAGRDCDIPFTAMELTTVVAESIRMCRLADGPDHFDFSLTGIKIGPVAFCGIPGEPFTEVGRQIKKAEGWKMVCPTINTNGKEGYFPLKEAYEEGGYEARASRFKGGVAEAIMDGGLELLKEMNA